MDARLADLLAAEMLADEQEAEAEGRLRDLRSEARYFIALLSSMGYTIVQKGA